MYRDIFCIRAGGLDFQVTALCRLRYLLWRGDKNVAPGGVLSFLSLDGARQLVIAVWKIHFDQPLHIIHMHSPNQSYRGTELLHGLGEMVRPMHQIAACLSLFVCWTNGLADLTLSSIRKWRFLFFFLRSTDFATGFSRADASAAFAGKIAAVL